MTRFLSDLRYTKMALPPHNPEEVAWLIYESAPSLFSLMFGGKAISLLTAFVQRSHNRFSHRYTWVAEAKDQVLGIAIAIPAAELQDQADFPIVLNIGQQLRLRLARRLILKHLLQDDYPSHSLYIANLAVHPEYRSSGIGTQLLLHCIAEAQAMRANEIFISVDIHNPRAQKLYESLEFQVQATKSLTLFGRTFGSCVLVRSLIGAAP